VAVPKIGTLRPNAAQGGKKAGQGKKAGTPAEGPSPACCRAVHPALLPGRPLGAAAPGKARPPEKSGSGLPATGRRGASKRNGSALLAEPHRTAPLLGAAATEVVRSRASWGDVVHVPTRTALPAKGFPYGPTNIPTNVPTDVPTSAPTSGESALTRW
jgi:hypothetical protein